MLGRCATSPTRRSSSPPRPASGVLGQKIRITGAHHVPAQRRRPARRQPHRLRRLRLRRAGRQPVGPQGPVHVQARAVRPPVDRPADALAAPHRGRPGRGRGARCATAVDYLKAGEAVGIFPEATISRALELKEFKTGAVRIAAEAGVPLVPVILWGTQRMMTKDHPRDFSRGKTITLSVGTPLHPDRRGPGRRDRRAAPGDVVDARRGDPRPTPPTSSRRAAGGCRSRYGGSAPRPWRRPRRWTRRRSASGRRGGRPSAEKSI